MDQALEVASGGDITHLMHYGLAAGPEAPYGLWDADEERHYYYNSLPEAVKALHEKINKISDPIANRRLISEFFIFRLVAQVEVTVQKDKEQIKKRSVSDKIIEFGRSLSLRAKIIIKYIDG